MEKYRTFLKFMRIINHLALISLYVRVNAVSQYCKYGIYSG